MKPILNFLLLTASIGFLSTTVNAQTDKEAQDLIKSMSAKYKAMGTLKANFTIANENPKTKNVDKQPGNISLKGDKYKLEFAGQEVISDGVTVWTFLKESNEVQINNPTTDKDAISPSNIFTMYDKGFLYKFVEEKTEDGVLVQVLDLTPTDKKRSFFKIRLTISKADKQIVSSKILDKSGNKSTYTIQKFIPNPPLPDNMFTFDKTKHPGVEMNDLR
jgi:outer membrane lipoprotein carrier protein